MIKYFLIASATLCLVSCTQVNTNGDKTITQGDDTLAEVDISLSKMDAVEELSNIEDEPKKDKVVFKASGTEPGWFAEISNLKIRVVLDYGKDSVNLDYKGPAFTEKAGFDYQGKGLSINIVPDVCVDAASGDKKDSRVVISYKNKKYTGCGSFVK
ncbi:MAG: hypothetical protein V4580_06115 [Bacteroidota bacterium]